MANYQSAYTGAQIDAAVGAVQTAVAANGIVNTNGLNTVLGNYLTSSSAANIYTPLNGTGASGTWGINITGSADSATKDGNGDNIVNTYQKKSDAWVIKGGYETFSKSGSTSIGSTTYYATGTINYGYTFSSAPWVQVSAADLAGGVYGAEIDGAIGTSSVKVTIYGADTATYGVHWIAIGK